ncbi:MAG: hypothetical protein A2469_04095 [Candidatus Magasanikbacteria bacterium RIFOXYC2_FULL_40_16]|uniref:Uncharacterized protein n=2 Tax=Candidatus Magasanikiibacteriota TaxID=1752731 RepID=A0A1F6NIY6_9BACT|nr:MAG: hypothetical protein A2373_00675 [Candidatus Magasanikbacteria bacterium RIFOXYB1_FULL_40_15]OGH89393.1 MAG: hypothetical protein A2469_04095 [Candidatus Magasanikbacteria bacterium RIFOXYC2_FULL_40_16]
MKYILGILAILLGVVVVVKAEWFVINFGSIAWAEEHLGTSGGSRLMYKLIGLAMIIISIMIMTDMAQEIFLSVMGRTFGID